MSRVGYIICLSVCLKNMNGRRGPINITHIKIQQIHGCVASVMWRDVLYERYGRVYAANAYSLSLAHTSTLIGHEDIQRSGQRKRSAKCSFLNVVRYHRRMYHPHIPTDTMRILYHVKERRRDTKKKEGAKE